MQIIILHSTHVAQNNTRMWEAGAAPSRELKQQTSAPVRDASVFQLMGHRVSERLLAASHMIASSNEMPVCNMHRLENIQYIKGMIKLSRCITVCVNFCYASA